MKSIEINTETGEITEREVADVSMPEIKINYGDLVSSFIREKYSIDEETAINRQRDTRTDEFQIYFDFCEMCKLKAKEML